MCGILGVVGDVGNDSRYQDALSLLSHRGPDNQQYWSNESSVWFGHTRLSILDLDSRSNQPMVSSDSDCVLIYNGEIYNFQVLRTELEKKGLRFETTSDTEVVLKGIETFGEDFIRKLNGMFALAFYNPNNNSIILARDRFGIKPLYLYNNDNKIAFASELKALRLAIPNITTDLSHIREYLNFGCLLGPRTFYSNVSQIEPGEIIRFDVNSLSVIESKRISHLEPPTDPGMNARLSNGSSIQANIRMLLEESVERQLMSDVPVGLFLSGGIDSSAIAAFATKHYGSKLKTFTASFDFMSGGDELEEAAYVSKYFNTEHHEFRIEGKNLPENLYELSYFFDEPFGDAANIPLYLMSKEVRDHCRVVLQGDGGDEIFGGYHYHRRLKYHKLFYTAGLINKLFSSVIRGGSRKTRTLEAVVESDPYSKLGRFFSSVMNTDDIDALLSASVRSEQSAQSVFSRYKDIDVDLSKSWLDKILYADRNIILPDLYLPKVDRATMATSLETRVPFLDNDLVNYVSGISGNQLLHNGKTKGLLRDALKGVIPERILFAKKKGFGVPFGNWMKASLYDFTKHELSNCSLLSDTPLKLLEEHKLGKYDHSFVLWRLLQLAIWWRRENS